MVEIPLPHSIFHRLSI